jgi:hypothetical protein
MRCADKLIRAVEPHGASVEVTNFSITVDAPCGYVWVANGGATISEPCGNGSQTWYAETIAI